jgi:hypothetical protein
MQLAEITIADKLTRESKIPIRSLLGTDLEYSAVVTNRIDKRASLCYRKRQRLFSINILAGLYRYHAVEAMPEFRSCDNNCVNIVPAK